MNEESEAAEENSCNTTPEFHDYAHSHTIETQQVSADTASYSCDDNLMHKVATYIQYYINTHRHMIL